VGHAPSIPTSSLRVHERPPDRDDLVRDVVDSYLAEDDALFGARERAGGWV
jgi:hypothetical protein